VITKNVHYQDSDHLDIQDGEALHPRWFDPDAFGVA
jgi:hypothetical protein